MVREPSNKLSEASLCPFIASLGVSEASPTAAIASLCSSEASLCAFLAVRCMFFASLASFYASLASLSASLYSFCASLGLCRLNLKSKVCKNTTLGCACIATTIAVKILFACFEAKRLERKACVSP
jgi:hypothetical protein